MPLNLILQFFPIFFFLNCVLEFRYIIFSMNIDRQIDKSIDSRIYNAIYQHDQNKCSILYIYIYIYIYRERERERERERGTIMVLQISIIIIICKKHIIIIYLDKKLCIYKRKFVLNFSTNCTIHQLCISYFTKNFVT